MGFYASRILPHLIDIGMRQDMFAPYRRRLVPSARGRVLEIGVGSGLNFPLYGPGAERLIAVEPSARLLEMARRSPSTAPRIDLVQASAEALPFDTASMDTVVTSWTLCSIPDVEVALREMRRVLKRSGELRFVEHGRAPDAGVARWQDRLTPLWTRVAGGCHLNRAISSLLEEQGFRIDSLEAGYMKGPRLMTFMYEGVAVPA